MTWMWITISVAVATVMTGAAGYWFQPDRGTGVAWLGIAAIAAGVICNALVHDLTYLILLLIVPLGYLAVRFGSRLRDRAAGRDR